MHFSPAPENADFVTMWARGLELDFLSWVVEFRDYPQPYMLVSDGHIWGKLAGVEEMGQERSRRSCSIHLGGPWGSFEVSRNMPPLKFFYDLSSGACLPLAFRRNDLLEGCCALKNWTSSTWRTGHAGSRAWP